MRNGYVAATVTTQRGIPPASQGHPASPIRPLIAGCGRLGRVVRPTVGIERVYRSTNTNKPGTNVLIITFHGVY
ncbi:hypothetical protein [Embleya scabrispora]|uniref:hypothetical protein n=1 Tax=Embleya scabrispora TaxID=159449 RepID=UPI00131A224D|nr:hypothetical protein [Embleya scabrispora]MYS82397.1 hypothetical protein [Streptomyces sp. SID5474]